MAQFFTAKSNKLKKLSKKIRLQPIRLDHKGQGVAEHQGKVVFIPGLLPGELAEVQLTEQKKRFSLGKVVKRLTHAEERIAPHCQHFGRCGGCQMQHLAIDDQRSYKQKTLLDLLKKVGGVEPEQVAQALVGTPWHYRRRARLAVKFDKGSLQLGFRQEGSNDIEAIKRCPVLVSAFSDLVALLPALVTSLKAKRNIGHIELIELDDANLMVLRVTKALTADDKLTVSTFATKHQLTPLLDSGDGITELDGTPTTPMAFRSGDQWQPLDYLPGDFIQVNDQVNRQMVAQAMEWLAPTKTDTVLELFAGIGNFSVPLAGSAKSVLAIEGVETMVARGNAMAAKQGLDNLRFCQGDLNGDTLEAAWLKPVDLMLLDPARAGASGALEHLEKWSPKRVLYVSCNPSSLARDAKLLTNQKYRLTRVGLVDMFPHTQHLESMALFERD